MKYFSSRAFTLLELLTVIVVISILIVMTFPILNLVKARVSKIRCIQNLKSLHTAAELYMQQYNHWPQIPTKLLASNSKDYAKKWNEALAPFGVSKKTWICPTTQELLGAPDYESDPQLARLDYLATPFDSKPRTAYKWSTQPWFAERSNVHSSGNLFIMPDGSIHQLSEYEKKK